MNGWQAHQPTQHRSCSLRSLLRATWPTLTLRRINRMLFLFGTLRRYIYIYQLLSRRVNYLLVVSANANSNWKYSAMAWVVFICCFGWFTGFSLKFKWSTRAFFQVALIITPFNYYCICQEGARAEKHMCERPHKWLALQFMSASSDSCEFVFYTRENSSPIMYRNIYELFCSYYMYGIRVKVYECVSSVK